MPILEGDIKLLKSQVMNDVDEGGGRATGNEIADGASNSIFTDISELDRTYGRVNLRKFFVNVDTANVDSYFGANIIIADPPDDPKVSCTLFTTNDGFDTRKEAQGRLESYVVAGPLAGMRLYGDQLIGQKVILLYQRVDQPLPEVGAVFVLAMETGVTYSQFVRISKVESSLENFVDGQGEYTRRVLTLTITDALRFKFLGEEPLRIITEANNVNTARVRRTSVADTARYYGTTTITEESALGALTAKAESIFSALVPSSTLETPIVLGDIFNKSPVVVAGVSRQVTWASNASTGGKLYVTGSIAPKTLTISSGAVDAYNPKSDDGKGNIVLPDGETVVGTVDYLSGVLSPDSTKSFAWSATPTATYTHGASFGQPAFTVSKEINLATRGSVFSDTMIPTPSAGTLTFDFMSQGKWYRLVDNGDGEMVGDEPSVGTGTVNYVTGAVLITIGALPDVDTSVIYSWGSSVDNFVRVTENTQLFSQVAVAGSVAVQPRTAIVTYTKAGVLKTLTDVATAGVLEGDGETGIIEYRVKDSIWGLSHAVDPVTLITIFGVRDEGTDITVSFKNLATSEFSSSHSMSSASASSLSFTLAQTNIKPHTLSLAWSVEYTYLDTSNLTAFGTPAIATANLTASDDGLGNIKLTSKNANNVICGTINYATGEVTINSGASIFMPVGVWVVDGLKSTPYGTPVRVYTGSQLQTFSFNFAAGTTFDVKFLKEIASPPTVTQTYTPPLSFLLAPTAQESIMPNSVAFKVHKSTSGYHNYVERSGVLYRDPNPINGAATAVGTVDLTTGRVNFTAYPTDVRVEDPVEVMSCLTEREGRSMLDLTFRTAGAPIRLASLYLQATATDSTLLRGNANTEGDITGDMIGKVNSINGIVYAAFSKPAKPDTVKYNAVVQSTLPLDAGILGLDPVRLPSDGRVPIFRTGEVAVVHHTATTLAQTVTNAEVVTLPRTRLSKVVVRGANGSVISTGYTADLDAGTVTFTNVAGYSQPITITHRIEDSALVVDTQISGRLRFSRPLTHTFPAGSFISSALIIGDMKARVPILFDQATWVSNAWADSIMSSPATATFNDVLTPITVTNGGAITERWIVRFTNTTSFEVIGEHVGVIAVGNTSTNCSPVNPASSEPYFNIPALGWGSGWAAGNILRFNTIGASFPVWVSRTIQQGPATTENDSFTVLVRGDIDRP